MERNAEHGVPVSEFLLRHGNAPTCLQTYSNTLCTWENTHTHTHTPTRKRSLWMETNVEKHGAACWSIYKVQAGGVCIVCQHACVCVHVCVCLCVLRGLALRAFVVFSVWCSPRSGPSVQRRPCFLQKDRSGWSLNVATGTCRSTIWFWKCV